MGVRVEFIACGVELIAVGVELIRLRHSLIGRRVELIGLGREFIPLGGELMACRVKFIPLRQRLRVGSATLGKTAAWLCLAKCLRKSAVGYTSALIGLDMLSACLRRRDVARLRESICQKASIFASMPAESQVLVNSFKHCAEASATDIS